jgi:hypothetical protein
MIGWLDLRPIRPMPQSTRNTAPKRKVTGQAGEVHPPAIHLLPLPLFGLCRQLADTKAFGGRRPEVANPLWVIKD